jgi:glycosyltransferase involved in cell wall biosynthesis
MTIAINCWVLRQKKLDGIGFFTVNTISRIIRNNPDVKFVILCDKNYKENYFDFENVIHKRVFPPYRHPLLYFIFLEFVVPFVLRKLKPDVFVSAEGFLSLSSNCKQLPVIYDLNFEHFPENLALKNRIYFKFFFKRFAKKAKRIATISEYSKKDIIDFYGIAENNIDNVSCGINSDFKSLNHEERNQAKDKFSEGKPYFFFIGSVHPRKNVNRLLQAFIKFKEKTDSDFNLVIGGSMMWNNSDIIKTYESSKYKNNIKFVGRLSNEDLKLALGGAYALAFVPVFEGFGLPIVEAFEANVPVLTSNVTSLPEVAGDAAIYANPFKVDEITDGLVQLYKNENGLIEDLISKGRIQKNKFSWEKTASLLWDSISKVANE